MIPDWHWKADCHWVHFILLIFRSQVFAYIREKKCSWTLWQSYTDSQLLYIPPRWCKYTLMCQRSLDVLSTFLSQYLIHIPLQLALFLFNVENVVKQQQISLSVISPPPHFCLVLINLLQFLKHLLFSAYLSSFDLLCNCFILLKYSLGVYNFSLIFTIFSCFLH